MTWRDCRSFGRSQLLATASIERELTTGSTTCERQIVNPGNSTLYCSRAYVASPPHPLRTHKSLKSSLAVNAATRPNLRHSTPSPPRPGHPHLQPSPTTPRIQTTRTSSPNALPPSSDPSPSPSPTCTSPPPTPPRPPLPPLPRTTMTTTTTPPSPGHQPKVSDVPTSPARPPAPCPPSPTRPAPPSAPPSPRTPIPIVRATIPRSPGTGR